MMTFKYRYPYKGTDHEKRRPRIKGETESQLEIKLMRQLVIKYWVCTERGHDKKTCPMKKSNSLSNQVTTITSSNSFVLKLYCVYVNIL